MNFITKVLSLRDLAGDRIGKVALYFGANRHEQQGAPGGRSDSRINMSNIVPIHEILRQSSIPFFPHTHTPVKCD